MQLDPVWLLRRAEHDNPAQHRHGSGSVKSRATASRAVAAVAKENTHTAAVRYVGLSCPGGHR